MNRWEFTVGGAAALMSAIAPATRAHSNTPLRWAPDADSIAIDMLACRRTCAHPFPDLNHPRRFETLGRLLSVRGHADARIQKILGGNFARVLGEIWG